MFTVKNILIHQDLMVYDEIIMFIQIFRYSPNNKICYDKKFLMQ